MKLNYFVVCIAATRSRIILNTDPGILLKLIILYCNIATDIGTDNV